MGVLLIGIDLGRIGLLNPFNKVWGRWFHLSSPPSTSISIYFHPVKGMS